MSVSIVALAFVAGCEATNLPLSPPSAETSTATSGSTDPHAALVAALDRAGIEPAGPVPALETFPLKAGVGVDASGKQWVAKGFKPPGVDVSLLTTSGFNVAGRPGFLVFNIFRFAGTIAPDADRCLAPWTMDPTGNPPLGDACRTESLPGGGTLVVVSFTNTREVFVISGDVETNINAGQEGAAGTPPIEEATQRALVIELASAFGA